jgi:hypothetical protein
MLNVEPAHRQLSLIERYLQVLKICQEKLAADRDFGLRVSKGKALEECINIVEN